MLAGPPRTARGASEAAADVWQDMLWWYLDRLQEFLSCGQDLSGTSESRMQSVSDCYYAGGIPAGADPSEGRAIIEQLNDLVTNDGGCLDPLARSRFLTDLRVMYTALGGDPSKLG